MSVPLIGPDGRKWSLDEAEVPEALRQGYRVETPDAPQSTGEAASEFGRDLLQGAGAALEGAVEGIAPGALSTAVGGPQGEAESPESYRRRRAESFEMLKRREEHPIAHGVGELGGMLVSPIGKVGAGIRTGIGATTKLGRIGASIAAGAAEGSLFGAGATVSDAMLGDAELTADKLIAGAGLGALLGGAGGGVGAGIEEGARAVMPKLGRAISDAQKTLDELANDAAVKATRSQQGVINRIGEAKVAQAGKVLRERGHLELLSKPDDILKSLEQDIAKTGATKGGFLDAADAVSKPDFAAALKAIDDFATARSPLEREAMSGALSKARTALEDIATDPKLGTWRAFDKWKQDLQSMAKFSRGAAEDDLALGLRRQLAGVAREELDRQLVPALGKDGAKFLESKSTYAALKDAERLAISGAGRAKPGGFGLGLYDLLAGQVGGALHPAGIAAAVASKFMREQAPAVVAKVADAVSKSPALAAVAKSMGASLGAVAPRLGPYGPVLAQAFAQSPEAGLATHMTMAQVDPGYAATAEAAGLTLEDPETHTAALSRAQSLADMAASVRIHDEAVVKGVDQVIKGGGSSETRKVLARQDFGEKRMRRDDAVAYDKRVEEVRQFASSPEAFLERISQNLEGVGGVAPGVAAALAARANVAVQYLAKSAEVPPKPGPLAREWTPTQAERYEFMQKLEVVEDPMSVLQNAAAGTLTEMQVETLRVVYPSLYKSIADAAWAKLTEKPEDVPYTARMMLSVLTGIDVDGTLSQDAVARNQQAIHSTRGTERENAAPQSTGARSEMTLAARTASPQQRREMETASEQA